MRTTRLHRCTSETQFTEHAMVMKNGKSVLITGGTDGIGLALTELHIALGDRVYIVGKRRLADTPLVHYRSNHIHYIQHDLANVTTIDTIWQNIHKSCQTLDYVYLNAAVGYCGDILTHQQSDIKKMIDVGIMANISLLKGLSSLVSISSLVRVIGSLAAFYRHHSIAVYSAVKAALITLVTNINAEHAYPCTISYIVIGAVHTNFHQKSGMTPEKIKKIRGHSATTIAHNIYTSKPKELVVIGYSTNLLYYCLKIVWWWQMLTAPIPSKRVIKKQRRRLSAGSIPNANDTIRKRALIVGAAEGIGLSICNILLRADYDLVVVDYQERRLHQNLHRLSHVDSGSTIPYHFMYCDLTDQASVTGLVNELITAKPFDAVYLPAAISAVAPFNAITTDIYQNLIQCNSMAHLHLLCRLLQHNKINARGSIVLFSSLAHCIPYPGAAGYAATKTMCAVFAQSLYNYLKKIHNITIYTAILGPVDTNHAARYSPDNSRKHLRHAPERVAQSLTTVSTHTRKHSPTLFISIKDKWIALLATLFPRFMKKIIKKAIYDKLTKPLLPH